MKISKMSYSERKRKVRKTLTNWGFSEKLIRKIINKEHKLGDIEKIMKETIKRKPINSAKYFLRGINYYRENANKKPLYRSLTKFAP